MDVTITHLWSQWWLLPGRQAPCRSYRNRRVKSLRAQQTCLHSSPLQDKGEDIRGTSWGDVKGMFGKWEWYPAPGMGHLDGM